MTLPRLYAMSKYWRKHPPLHIMVAAYLGMGGKADESEDDSLPEFATIPEYE